MIQVRSIACAGSLLLLGACQPPILIAVPPHPSTPPLNETLSDLGLRPELLQRLSETALVIFDADDCPVRVVDVVPNCPPGLEGEAICRGESGNPQGIVDKARFSNGSSKVHFGLTFAPDNPCVNPNMGTPAPEHMCVVKSKGTVYTEVYKYTVTVDSASCPVDRRVLDPYFIVVRR